MMHTEKSKKDSQSDACVIRNSTKYTDCSIRVCQAISPTCVYMVEVSP